MREDRASLIRTMLDTWRRLFPSPGRVARAAISPRRLLGRLRLRWVAFLATACLVWLVAVCTEPVSPRPIPGASRAASSAVAGRGTPSSGPKVASSPEAASRFFTKLAAAARAGVRTGRIRFSVTDVEATSALDAMAQLAEIRTVMSTLSPEELEELDSPEEIRRVLDARRDDGPPGDLPGRIRYAMTPGLRFRDAQVRFQPGRVVVAGYVQAWSRRAPVYMDAELSLDAGQVRLDFHESRIGRLRVPNWMLAGPANLLGLVVGLGGDYASIDLLDVENGRLTLAGSVTRPRG